MVRIRMQRLGRHRRPFYRINAVDKRTRRDGAAIEQLGWYNPVEKDPAKQIFLNVERIKHWLSVGAQPSDTCRDFLAKHGVFGADAMKSWEADRAEDRQMVAEKAAKAAAEGDKKDDKKNAKKG